jgi:hypothetical protein
MVNIVESSNLGEETSKRLILSEVNGTGPIVPPLDHGSGFQNITPNFVNVISLTWFGHRPVAEGKHEL